VVSTQKIYSMLGNEWLWNVACRCHELLSNANISYSICGGMAVCLHGYQRNTANLDLVYRRGDCRLVRELLARAGFVVDEVAGYFRSPEGIAIQFLVAGEKAGKDTQISIAEPLGDSNVEVREGLNVVRLSKLIEMKLACGMSNLRRTHKDFADVVELICIRELDGSFARFLHPDVRDAFRQLVRNAAG
jgi:hypothetical protein